MVTIMLSIKTQMAPPNREGLAVSLVGRERRYLLARLAVLRGTPARLEGGG